MNQRLSSPATASAAPLAGNEGTGGRIWLPALLLVVEWTLLVAAVGLWVASKTYSTWMNAGSALVVGSWAARWARLGRVIRPTPLDFPLVLFLLSAVAASVVAPDRSAALVRLYLLLGAAALFYLLATSGDRTLRVFADGLIVAGAALGLYFASQHNWADQPAKFAVIGSVGRRLNGLIADLGLYKPHPNVVAGVLALAAPIALVRFGGEIGAWRAANSSDVAGALGLAVTGLGSLLILFGVVMAESRTSWLALGVAGGIALWWWLAARMSIRKEQEEPQGRLFWAGVGLAAAAGAVGVILRPQLLTVAFGSLPGPNSVVSRVDIYGQVWRLAQDTPFTGGGLDAFPALYSTYVLDIPFLFLTHAHNAYLNVLVEQGWPGLLGYVGLLGAALWAAARQMRCNHDSRRQFAVAGALGLVVILFHGLGEGTLVASRATPALLVPAGLAVAGPAAVEAGRAGGGSRRWRLGLAGAAAAVLLGIAWLGREQWLSAWHANLGAVTHNRIELAGWPTGKWDDGSRSGLYAQAGPELQKALELQPDNRTANHRLGLEAMSRRDFTQAVTYLEQAHATDLRHRGVIKALGYTYVWLGVYDRAEPLLAQIPEARGELEVYAWWWGTLQRADLAARANDMIRRLGS